MASKTLQFKYTVGATLFINVYARTGGAALNLSGPIACTADGTESSLYKAVMTDAASGVVNVDVISAGVVIGSFVTDLVEAVGNYELWDGPTVVQIAAGVNIGTGSGANSVVVHVQDAGTGNLQGCLVTVLNGTTPIATGQTYVNGLLTVALPNGTFTLVLYMPGYNGSSTTIVISASGTLTTIHLSLIVITPSTPPYVTGYTTALDSNNQPVAGIVHTNNFISMPDGSTGNTFAGDYIEATSASNGLVQFTNLIVGANYQYRRENADGTSGDWVPYVAQDADFELPDATA